MKAGPSPSPPRAHVRVLQVVLRLDAGGTERLVIEITKRLSTSIDVRICCLEDHGAWADEVRDLGIPVYAFHRRQGFRPGLGRRLAQIAGEHGVTVLHCHQYSPFVYGCIAKVWKPRLQLVFTEHGRLSDAPPTVKRRAANQLLGRLPGSFFAVSHDLRRYMLAEGFPPGRVAVIHNGIDVGSVPTAADRLRARAILQVKEDDFLAGSVARLDPVKDFERMLEAFALLRQRRGRARLVLIGDGPERGSIEAQARTLGISDVVIMTGQHSSPRVLLPALDVYVNSSISEGISLTILEAMAAALPVVATRVGGTPEVVLDQETGYLVPSRDAEALAAAIERVAAAPEDAAALGRAGRARVEASFTLDAMVDQYYRQYLALAGSASPTDAMHAH